MVGGVVLGSLLSAWTSGQFQVETVPPMWAETFGPEALPRILTAFAGGTLMAIGARWAGGCTSGHGITGTLQLAVSSWVAVICFFAGGIIVALLIY
jgi:uncharacterized membrane protein YedE/YeeE